MTAVEIPAVTDEERPVEWSVWPPPLASRAIRRHCTHMVKAGYCALCGTKVTKL